MRTIVYIAARSHGATNPSFCHPRLGRGSRVFLLSFCFCLSSPTPIGDPGFLLFPAFMKRTDTGSSRLTEGKGKDDRRRRCRHYNYLSVIPDPDRGSRVFAFSCVHEENGHWILAFARMTEGKGKDDRRRRCRHYNYLSVIPDPDRGSRVFAFSCVHEENGHWILAFARMTEGKGKDDRRRRCRRYNYLSVIPDSDRGSRVFAFSCVHEENGHWILAFARMTEGKGKDDRRERQG